MTNEKEYTADVTLRCDWCDSLIIRNAIVPRDGTDAEKLKDVLGQVEAHNVFYRHIGPQIDKDYIFGLDEAYCGEECRREVKREQIRESALV